MNWKRKLSIKVRPMSWPIGIGATFQGVYDLFSKGLRLFDPGKTKVEQISCRSRTYPIRLGR
jgi:peptide chain release factor 3